jgi:hypothetical protein
MTVLLEDAVSQLRERIEEGASRIAIQAPPGFGKTTLLKEVAAAYAKSRRVVRIEIPEGDDAALVALVEAATQLDAAMPGLLDRVVPQKEPARVPWGAKLAALKEALGRAGDDLLVLLDGPRFQAAAGPEGELFAGRSVEITETLLRARAGTIVLAGPRIPEGIAEDAGFRLPLVRDASKAAEDDTVFRLGGYPARALSPVVLQVLQALRASGIDVEQIPAKDLRLERLVAQDLGSVVLRSPEMRRVLARLAALRVPFSSGLLKRAGLLALPPQSRAVVQTLVEGRGDGVSWIPSALSEAIRARIQVGDPAWETNEPAGEIHRFAASYHRERFEAARSRGDIAAAVREELEEIHQLTEAGDAGALLARSLQFVEQYDALGKSLSQKALRAPREQEEKLRRDALRAYERAIEHDGRDAYAHHYIAYNLDILGAEPERVEREYIAARDLDKKHAWYHSRLVCFLITTAWMQEAREAWDRALGDLADTGESLQSTVYEELHAQVARLLLSRSELDFAAVVLEDVPDELRTEGWWRALHQLMVCLEEDRDERLVFPPTVALEERWDGPHLTTGPDEPVAVHAWQPGRVIGRDDKVAVILCSRGSSDVSLSTTRLSLQALLDEWHGNPASLSVGAFVELIEYLDGTKALKTWDRKSSSFDAVPGLRKLFPPPDRYIRRALA